MENQETELTDAKGVVLNAVTIEAIAQRAVSLLLQKMPQLSASAEGITAIEAMRILSCVSMSALYRELDDLGVRPYRQGKYRRQDITNALGRRSHAIHEAARRKASAGVSKKRVPPGWGPWGG